MPACVPARYHIRGKDEVAGRRPYIPEVDIGGRLGYLFGKIKRGVQFLQTARIEKTKIDRDRILLPVLQAIPLAPTAAAPAEVPEPCRRILRAARQTTDQQASQQRYGYD